MRTIAKIAVGALLFFSPAHAARMVPRELPDKQTVWKDCSELIPLPGADDGSMFETCTRVDNKLKYEIVYRPHGERQCTESVPKEPDGYQHFMCSEQYELMFRILPKSEVPHGKDAPPKATVPNAESGLSQPR